MKILSYILSPIFAFVFFLILIVFHPLQWIGLKIFGYKGHKFIVDIMNLVLTRSLLILGVPVKRINKQEIPKNKTIVFVSNHQSLFDISPISWYFRKHHAKFVSKKELGKGIPSVSFNLRHGGAALIDRKDGKSALLELGNFAKRINKNTWSAVIFPEGTRSRDGRPKSFSTNGIKMILKRNPEALIVPLSINNSWKVFKYGKFPLGLFSPITIYTHEPIDCKSMDIKELLELIEEKIKSKIN
ncbi:MAG: lysophospholipid acyltransferase family protein [Flavobacteriales bacterium]|jgi:1-acyl-sn-glycerol-3-phosphate acyltransferase|nr:1-acyl-sn-glycerol-3-phosphate acyltransferase [Flavobacteriales bacterium]